MSIDSMRVGGGRCPPVLVGGLFVVCMMLVINWYSLSSENLELLRQIDELGEQLKISAEERDQCVTLRGNLEQRYKKLKEEVASLHVRTAQFELKRTKDDMSLTACRTELGSLKEVDKTRSATLEALRLDKERTSTQLEEKREENKKLQEDLDKVKNELETARGDLEKAKNDLETAKAAINAPNGEKVVEIVPKAEANTKLKNSVDNGAGQELQEDEDQMKAMMNGGNPMVDTEDEPEQNNVDDEDKDKDEDKDQQKLATNEQEKQQDPQLL